MLTNGSSAVNRCRQNENPQSCVGLASFFFNIIASGQNTEKCILSESGKKYAQIKHHLQHGMDFTGGSVIIDYGLVFGEG